MSRALSATRIDVLRVAIDLARLAPQTEESTALLAAVERFVAARGLTGAGSFVYNGALVSAAKGAWIGWQDRAAGAAAFVAKMALDDADVASLVEIGELVAHAVPESARAIWRPTTLPRPQRPPVYRALARAVRRLPADVLEQIGVERHWSAGRPVPYEAQGRPLDAREAAVDRVRRAS